MIAPLNNVRIDDKLTGFHLELIIT